MYCPPPREDGTTPLPSAFTFVNSHLAAFDTGLEKRDTDFQDISKRLSFRTDQQYTPQQSKDPDSSEPRLRVYESDAVFWMVGSHELAYVQSVLLTSIFQGG